MIHDPTLSMRDRTTLATVASSLEELHGSQIIDKDIKPQNIILNLETQQAKITNLSAAAGKYPTCAKAFRLPTFH